MRHYGFFKRSLPKVTATRCFNNSQKNVQILQILCFCECYALRAGKKKQINCPHAVIIAFIGLDVQTHPQAFIFCQ